LEHLLDAIPAERGVQNLSNYQEAVIEMKSNSFSAPWTKRMATTRKPQNFSVFTRLTSTADTDAELERYDPQ